MKKILIFFLVFVFIFSTTFAVEKFNIREFTNEISNYNGGTFPELANENWVTEVISRKYEIRWTRLN